MRTKAANNFNHPTRHTGASCPARSWENEPVRPPRKMNARMSDSEVRGLNPQRGLWYCAIRSKRPFKIPIPKKAQCPLNLKKICDTFGHFSHSTVDMVFSLTRLFGYSQSSLQHPKCQVRLRILRSRTGKFYECEPIKESCLGSP